MADNGDNSNSNRGNRAAVVTVLVILLVVVTVVVIQMIQKAPMAGSGGPSASGDGPPKMPPAAVIVAAVEQENTQEKAIVTGTLRAVAKADVAAQEAGAVAEVLVDEGAAVQAGAPLAVLDARRLQAQVAEAKARVTAAESLLKQREAELFRAETDLTMKAKLGPTKAISKSDLLDAEKNLTVAKSQLQAAKDGIDEARSRLELLAVQLEDLTVKAPFGGTVVARHVEPGEWLAAGATVASLVTVDPVEAWLRVPSRFLDGAANDTNTFRVRQSATGDLFAPNKVTRIPEVDGRSQLFMVVATIPNSARKLTPGESVTGVVPIGRPAEYLRVPINGIVNSPQGTIVQIVQAAEGEGMPTGSPVPVQVAFERDGAAFILADQAGFKAGDQVVVEGNQRLMPGQSLMIKTPDAQGGPPTP